MSLMKRHTISLDQRIAAYRESEAQREGRFMALVELAIQAKLPVPQEVREEWRVWRGEQWRRQEAAVRQMEAV